MLFCMLFHAVLHVVVHVVYCLPPSCMAHAVEDEHAVSIKDATFSWDMEKQEIPTLKK